MMRVQKDLVVRFIPSKENVETDEESQVKNVDTEWEFAKFAFDNIVRSFENPKFIYLL